MLLRPAYKTDGQSVMITPNLSIAIIRDIASSAKHVRHVSVIEFNNALCFILPPVSYSS